MTLGTNMVSPPAGSGSIAITPVVSNTVDSDKASPRSSIQRKVSANENKTIKEAEREDVYKRQVTWWEMILKFVLFTLGRS